MNTYTEASALNLHSIAPLDATEEERIDLAREAGIVHLCLGCGFVSGIDVDLYGNALERETARQQMSMYFQSVCCDDSDEVIY